MIYTILISWPFLGYYFTLSENSSTKPMAQNFVRWTLDNSCSSHELLGNWLGPAKNYGDAFTYYILTTDSTMAVFEVTSVVLIIMTFANKLLSMTDTKACAHHPPLFIYLFIYLFILVYLAPSCSWMTSLSKKNKC